MMNLDRKSLPDTATGTSSRQVRILLIGGEHAEAGEIQAALAHVPGIGVESVPTLARLSIVLQKGGSKPDILVIDLNPDRPDDLTLIRDLKKVSGMEDV